MKIKSLKLSNILSFKYYENLDEVPEIVFDDNLSVLIGHNGSGKSTALELIHLLFGNIFFSEPRIFPDRKGTTNQNGVVEVRDIGLGNFRIQKNRDFPDKEQKILVKIELDSGDMNNIRIIQNSRDQINQMITKYSTLGPVPDYSTFDYGLNTVELLVELPGLTTPNLHNIKINGSRFVDLRNFQGDLVVDYLVRSNSYSQLIDFYNEESLGTVDEIPSIRKSFSYMGAFRNYGSVGNRFDLEFNLTNRSHQNTFQTTISERSSHQIENGEPMIFAFMRGKLALIHSELVSKYGDKKADFEILKNTELVEINEYLKWIGLKMSIHRISPRSFAYNFYFASTNDPLLTDIEFNSLSAGQRSFLHLIFEIVGNSIQEGLLVIDEPELHLHKQLQHAYLSVIKKISSLKSKHCQFIVVTHSEVFVNEDTIENVIRFTLEPDPIEITKEYTNIYKNSNLGKSDREKIIQLLDNKRAGDVFFVRKVVLVEGEMDRYFFQNVLDSLYPDKKEEIVILDIGGKTKYSKWAQFLRSFGITTYYIGDFDNVLEFKILNRTQLKKLISDNKNLIIRKIRGSIDATSSIDAKTLLNNLDSVISGGKANISDDNWQKLASLYGYLLTRNIPSNSLKSLLNRANLVAKIEEKYTENVFILKSGDLENYTNMGKSLESVISFCENEMNIWLKSRNKQALEIKKIIKMIVN